MPINEDCRAFCPMANYCYEQHNAITVAQESIEQSQENTTKHAERLERHLAQQTDEVAFEQIAIQLIGDGIRLGDGADRDVITNASLDNLAVHQKWRDETAEKLAEVALEKARYDQLSQDTTEELQQSHAAMALLDEAEIICTGPRLRLTGRMLLARAALRDWIGIIPAGAYETYKIGIFKKYAKCIQPKAKEAAAMYKPRHAKAA